MARQDSRLIVAYFGNNKADALDTLKHLQAQSVKKAWLIDASTSGQRLSSGLHRFQGTLLDNEYLVAGNVQLPLHKSALDKIRSSTEFPVFILTRNYGSSLPASEGASTDSASGTPSTLKETILALAESHVSFSSSAKGSLTKLFERAEQRLASSYQSLQNSALLGHTVTSTGEWLLDNHYLFEVHGAEVKANLPKRFGSNVPGVASSGGIPRIYELACKLTCHLDFAISQEAIVAALEDYQSQETLNVAEIWLFPVVLRLALFEGISQIALRAAHAQDTREYAYFWTNRLVAAARNGPTALEQMIETLVKDPLIRNEYFVSVLVEQLHEEDLALAQFQERMASLSSHSLSEVIRQQHQTETTDRVTVTNAIGSLRKLGQTDFTEIFEQVSRLERILKDDPAKNYPQASFSTRDECRRQIERLARLSTFSESGVATIAVDLAAAGTTPLCRHVEYYLLGDGLETLESTVQARLGLVTKLSRSVRRHPTFTYLSLVALLTFSIAGIFAASIWSSHLDRQIFAIALALVAAFPLSDFSIQIVNTLIVSLLPPASLPRMNFEAGIPQSCRTLVAVPMMLVNQEVLARELAKLQTRYAGNTDPSLHYALIADFIDARSEHTPSDDALLDQAKLGIDALRNRYSTDRFHLYYRQRTWSESEQAWIGRERKRGKLEDLNASLCGQPSSILVYPSRPESIAFVIALDSDTGLPAEAGRKLIQTIAHPLNRIQLTPDGRHRLSGYTIIQPRIGIGLRGASVTRFTHIFADARGTDPYCHAVSDLYQDLFAESIFHGKAIYDVAAMHAILDARFPDYTILSHDLIEGAHVGVAADTKIELFESLPSNYGAFANRQHRWTRGDWQIAPWVFSSVSDANGTSVPNPLHLVSRWQILDNLRRSLVAPFSILLLFLAWLFSTSAGISTILVAIAAGLPYLAPVVDRLAKNASRETHGLIGIREDIQRIFVHLALMPHQAWLSVDAIARVLYRQWISRRNLLEWQTADAVSSSGKHLSKSLRETLYIAGASLLLIAILSVTGNVVQALPFLLLWASGPLVILWLGRPVPQTYPHRLNDQDQDYLRIIARRTWRTFDDLVGVESHWLPPDNTQLSLRMEVAQRTSPTNIGMWFTSLLAASDFAFIAPGDFEERCRESISTLKRLDRYEGHWLNWYDLKSLEPLNPRYVSTVDSGNLIVCMWVLEQGLKDTCNRPSPSPHCLEGMASTLEVLGEVMGEDAAVALPLNNLRTLLRNGVEGYEIIDRLKQAKLQIHNLKRSLAWFASEPSEASYWVKKLEQQCNAWLAYCNRYLPWMETLAAAPDQLLRSIHPQLVAVRWRAMQTLPSLSQLADGSHEELHRIFQLTQSSTGSSQSAWLLQLTSEYQAAQKEAGMLIQAMTALGAEVAELAASVDMGFLYDPARKLFGIGYEVGAPKVFSSHYDLLASECRLASLAAIAKGEIPTEHWHTLGRPYVSTADGQRLLSWSGTMFEYLMPVLFMKPFENSFLAEAARLAVRAQRDYAEALDRPWGSSEAAYSALDANQIYQYRAFGVPSLSLSRGIENELVISPYSSMLALQIDSLGAVENLRRLSRLGLYGPMGFYESIDYTRPADPSGSDGVIIYSYMAHHQGMGLTALANVLLDGTMQRRFHQNLLVRSVEPLLYERVPAGRSLLRHAAQERPLLTSVKPEDVMERNPGEFGLVPNVQLLGNGAYFTMVNNSGSGFSQWRDFEIGRWTADSAIDQYGTYFFIRDLRTMAVWSPSLQPAASFSDPLNLTFSASRVQFQRSMNGIEQCYEICVAPDDDLEIRRFSFSNRGLRTRHLDITSFIELSLAPHAADRAHPAFSKLFVQTEWLPQHSALIATRRPRSPGDATIWVAHVLICGKNAASLDYETSREAFVGRNRTLRTAQALGTALSQSTGTVLDPIFSIRFQFSLDARERIEFAFLTLAAPTREALLTMVEKYAQ